MTDHFPKALAYVLANEGGFVNDPLDPGGATNFGITLQTLSEHWGAPCSIDNLRTIENVTVEAVYLLRYWKPLGCHRVDDAGIATALFDVGVLFGIGTAALLAQKALTQSGFPDLIIDGHIGPRSLTALNAVGPEEFLECFELKLQRRIDDIISKRPTSERFRHGWEERVRKLRSLA